MKDKDDILLEEAFDQARIKFNNPRGYAEELLKKLTPEEQNIIKKVGNGELTVDDLTTIPDKTSKYGSDTLFDKIFTFFLNSGEMPYGTAKARTGDPFEWIEQQLIKLFGTGESLNQEATYPILTTPGDDKYPVTIKNYGNNNISVFFGNSYTWSNTTPQEVASFANKLFQSVRGLK